MGKCHASLASMRRQHDISPIQNALINAISVTGYTGLTQEHIDEFGSSTVGVANIRRAVDSLVEKGFLDRKAGANSTVRFVVKPFLRRVCTEGLPGAVFDLLTQNYTPNSRSTTSHNQTDSSFFN